jgi:glutathione S-transferase
VGSGPAHTDASLRLFGTREEDVRVTLYRDMAAWCPYCQKVWLHLEEKQIPYRVVKVPMRSYGDKPESFLRKVPSGLLPALDLDGELYTESLDIMQLLETTFPTIETVPRDPSALKRANELLRLERELFGWWCTLTFRRTLGNGAQEVREHTTDRARVFGQLDPVSLPSPS